jgi:hypothetical protein
MDERDDLTGALLQGYISGTVGSGCYSGQARRMKR